MSRLKRLAAICAVFGILAMLTVRVGDPVSPALRALKEHPEPLEIAILGDSRAHAGLSPRQMVDTFSAYGLFGVKVRNFGVDGTDVLHHASIVQNGFAKMQPPPRIILWTPNPLEFNQGRANNRLEQLEAFDFFWLARAGAPFETLLDLATMSVFPPWRHRPLVAHVLSDYTERAGLRTLSLQQKLLGLSYVPEAKSRVYKPLPDGQEPFEVLEWEDRFRRGAKVYATDYEKLRLSSWHFEVARRLARKARESGSLLIILEMPVSPWFRAHLANNAKHLEWRRRLRQIADEEGALYWDHSTAFGRDDREFGDPGHMPLETAARYSRFLAKSLNENPRLRDRLTHAL